MGKKIDYYEVKRLYNLGLHDEEIAEKMNCASRTVLKWRNRYYLPLNNKIDYDEMERLYNSGLPDKEISEKTNCSNRTVLRWRQSRKLPLNRHYLRRVYM